jgi:hypothetical protein
MMSASLSNGTGTSTALTPFWDQRSVSRRRYC